MVMFVLIGMCRFVVCDRLGLVSMEIVLVMFLGNILCLRMVCCV